MCSSTNIGRGSSDFNGMERAQILHPATRVKSQNGLLRCHFNTLKGQRKGSWKETGNTCWTKQWDQGKERLQKHHTSQLPLLNFSSSQSLLYLTGVIVIISLDSEGRFSTVLGEETPTISSQVKQILWEPLWRDKWTGDLVITHINVWIVRTPSQNS